MTRATAASRVAQADGTAGAGGGGARSVGRPSARRVNSARGDEGTLLYSDADLEPIRAALAALRAGDFRPGPGHADRGQAGHAEKPMVDAICSLADEVGRHTC